MKHTVVLGIFRSVIHYIMSTTKSFIVTEVVFELLVFLKYIQFYRKKNQNLKTISEILAINSNMRY